MNKGEILGLAARVEALDERDDPELCDMFPNMHGRIVKLFNEIEAARAMIAAIGEPQP